MKTPRNIKASRKRFKKQQKVERNQPKELIYWLVKTIDHFFPTLFSELKKVKDPRKQFDYTMEEILFAAFALFLFKKGSRNAMNMEREEEDFVDNYTKLFHLRLPHMDTVNDVLKELPIEVLEMLKTRLVHNLVNKKIFKNSRIDGYYRVAIDATRIMNVAEGHCDHCLYTESKNGKITCFHNVLEAKLITPWGLCISLGTEWIENPDSEYEKQDCELKAFIRLSGSIKKDYPRLKICIIADGLYPNEGFFNICESNGWKWILTFQDGNLPSVWKKVEENVNFGFRSLKCGDENYYWFNDLDYKGHRLNWIKGVFVDEKKKEDEEPEEHRHIFITNLDVSASRVMELVNAGRKRWKIENEGFNTQKNQGLNLCHQFSRDSMQAMKNYYQCLQIAHMILNLFEKWGPVKEKFESGSTIKHLTMKLLGELRERVLDVGILQEFLIKKIRVVFNN